MYDFNFCAEFWALCIVTDFWLICQRISDCITDFDSRWPKDPFVPIISLQRCLPSLRNNTQPNEANLWIWELSNGCLAICRHQENQNPGAGISFWLSIVRFHYAPSLATFFSFSTKFNVHHLEKSNTTATKIM